MLPSSSTPGALMTCKPRCPNARKEQALRLMAIRQARLEPLALSASSHERIVNGRSAASGEESIDLGKQSIPTTGLSPASPTALWAAEPDPTPPMTAHCSVCPHAHC